MSEPRAHDLLVLHDGAAGNRRQALALAERWALPFDELALAPRAPWRWASPRRLPGAEAAFGADFAARLAKPPALAIGCGRQAALATRLLKSCGAAVLQVLHPRIALEHWDRVVLPAHDGVSGANVVTLQGSLHPIDRAWLAAQRATQPEFGALPSPRTALFVGGPTEDSDWDAKALDAVLELLMRWRERDGGALLVAASRRTPASMRKQLKGLLAASPEHAIVWTGEADGPNPYAPMLAWAERIVVTPDSANLISEAAATDAPLWIAVPRYTRGRLRGLVDAAMATGRARPLGPDATPWPITPWRESARVADELKPWALAVLAAAAARRGAADGSGADQPVGAANSAADSAATGAG